MANGHSQTFTPVFLLGVTAVFCSYATPAQEQTQSTADDSSGDLQEVVVTGTAIRGIGPVGSATVNIGRDQIDMAGVKDAGALIQMIPQGSGLGTTLGNSNGRYAGVNLRGLGNSATLVLFDGHRTVSQGITLQISDPNTIPFAALERVEVVTDGASAVYGSDAVAGVVNYILRQPFNGAQFSARYTDSLYHQYAVEGVGGHAWDTGGVLFSVGYESNDRVNRFEIPALRSDLTAFGGNDGRMIATTLNAPGAAGAVIVGNTVYGLPDNLNGRVPTAAEVLALRGKPTLVDGAQYSDYYTERKRLSSLFRAQQSLGRFGDITGTVLANFRRNNSPGTGDGAFTAVGITVRPSSPYYIAGMPAGNQTVVYNFRANNPDRSLDQNNTDYTLDLLLDYKVPLSGNLQFSASTGLGRQHGCAVCQPQANTVLASTITAPATAQLFNPYQQGVQPNSEGLFGIFIQRAHNELFDQVAKVDGGIFELPGGTVRMAIGAEFQRINYWLQAMNSLNPTTTPQTSRYLKTDRLVKSEFAELYVPLVGAGNAMRGFQEIGLSLAGRHDSYSDFGGTTNPKIGLNWKPVNDLLVRGSWGKSFRAPTLAEQDPRTIGQVNRTLIPNGLNDPSIPVTDQATRQSLVLSSGVKTDDLTPERANIYSVGLDYTPSFVRSLRLSTTYYSVKYSDRISTLPSPTTALSNPATFAIYKDFFIPAPQPASCVNGSSPGVPGTSQYATYNPAYLPYLNNGNAAFTPTTANDCQLVGILKQALQNLGRVKQSGLDFTAHYDLDVATGVLSFDGAFTKILSLKRSLLPTSPEVDALDRIGEQISARGRLTVGFAHGAFTGNIAANYIGPYLNNATPTVNGVKVPDQNVPAWTTFDLNLALHSRASAGPLQGTRLSFSALNFTDKDAPLVLTSNNPATAVDLNTHNVFGRIWTLEVDKSF